MTDANPGPLVLVVDDAPINGVVTSMLLRQLGCRTVVVDNGAAAVQAVLDQPIALVLMDCQMPDMDGFEAAARIRARLAPGRRLPILALSGLEAVEDQQRSRQAGMDDHLIKPLQLAGLRSVIERWLPSGTAMMPDDTPAAAASPELLDRNVLAAFDRMCPGGSSMLICLFLSELARSEAALDRAIASGDLAAVVACAHKLKGSTATIGAQILSSAMRQLELAARGGSLPACQACWQQIPAVLAATREAIARCGATTAAGMTAAATAVSGDRNVEQPASP